MKGIWRGLVTALLPCLVSACAFQTHGSQPDWAGARALVDQGTMHLREGRLEEADASFLLALEHAPLPEAVDGLGCVRLIGGAFDDAEFLFGRAILLEPSYARAHANLALLREVRGDRPDARRLLARALELAPGDARARNNMAALSAAGGVRDRTRQLLIQATATDPHPLIRYNLMLLESLYGASKEKTVRAGPSEEVLNEQATIPPSS